MLFNFQIQLFQIVTFQISSHSFKMNPGRPLCYQHLNMNVNVCLSVQKKTLCWYLRSLFPHTSKCGGPSLRLMQVKSPAELPTDAANCPVSRL